MTAADEGVSVRVTVTNRGDAPAAPLLVEGELAGARDDARLEAGVAPGATDAVHLKLPAPTGRPGAHLLALHLRYPLGGGGAGWGSQRGYLLIVTGERAEPAVRLTVERLRLRTLGTVQVVLESADGQPHRVALRLLTPLGLNALDGPREVEVPAAGRVTAGLRILRGGASPGREHGFLVAASAIDGPLERTTVGEGAVEVLPRVELMTAARPALAVLGVLLCGATLVLELHRRRVKRGP